ncbi:prolactin-like [Chiloscyllium plagiosum]|uniref:prolactin-like n=1 Tax=Chiloscyllium plagiosum TaxID=36176 RepID=UPI001CB84809|nr:prolactin-like [Chiloscyllium plagiosum]
MHLAFHALVTITSPLDLLSLLVLVFGVLSKAGVIMATPICAKEGGECRTISVSELFHRASEISHQIHVLSTEAYNEFVSIIMLNSSSSEESLKHFSVFYCTIHYKMQVTINHSIQFIYDNIQQDSRLWGEMTDSGSYFIMFFLSQNQHFIQGQHLNFSIINSCHTSSIVTPQNKEDALRTPHERLLSLVIAILRSWQDPLQYVISEFSATHGNTSSILSKSMKIVKQMKRLAKGLNKISEQVLSYYCGASKLQYLSPVAQSTELSRHKNDRQYVFISKYFSFVFQVGQHSGAIEQTVPWEQPLAEDGDSLISQLYNLLHCFRRDTNKIDTYLKLLKCRFTQQLKC